MINPRYPVGGYKQSGVAGSTGSTGSTNTGSRSTSMWIPPGAGAACLVGHAPGAGEESASLAEAKPGSTDQPQGLPEDGAEKRVDRQLQDGLVGAGSQ
jgi:hypothetical protein